MNRLLLLFCLVPALLPAQTVTINMEAGTCFAFRQHVYAAGFFKDGAKLSIAVYKLDPTLKLIDSVFVPCAKGSAGDFQRISLDSLHGHLNVYVQKKGSPEVRIIRMKHDLNLLTDIAKTDVARLHNRAMLGTLPYYEGNRVYSIRTIMDTSGAQFYLIAYELKSESENYDYLQRWQFAFERKNVSSARVIHADSRLVTLFVEVGKGPKKGQWILSVNAKTGVLIRGSKLNAKGEELRYAYGAVKADTLNQVLHLVGEKQVSNSNTKFLPAHAFYYMKVDSFGEIVTRYSFGVPVTEQKRGSSKTPPRFRILFEELKTSPSGVEATADIYINNDIVKGCFNYCSSTVFGLNIAGDEITAAKYEIRSNRMIEDWLYLQDKPRMNGRLCPDSLGTHYMPLHKDLPFPVKVAFRKQDGTSAWLLRKTETARARVSFANTFTEKNVLKVGILAELPKQVEPVLHVLPGNRYVISSDDKDGRLLLLGGNW